MNRDFGTCVIIRKDLTFLSLESQQRRKSTKKKIIIKKYTRNKDGKIPKYEGHK